MTLYAFRNWSTRYEINRSRELRKLDWMPLPITDDDDYAAIVELPDGPAIYGCGVALLRLAARACPRGHLLRANGQPHTPSTLSRTTRMPVKLVNETLSALCSQEIGWLEKREAIAFTAEPAVESADPANPITGADPVIDLKMFCNQFYGRPATAHWSYEEESHLAIIARREDAVDEARLIQQYRAKLPPRDAEFFPSSVVKLLKNWTQVLDQARLKSKPAKNISGARASVAEAQQV